MSNRRKCALTYQFTGAIFLIVTLVLVSGVKSVPIGALLTIITALAVGVLLFVLGFYLQAMED